MMMPSPKGYGICCGALIAVILFLGCGDDDPSSPGGQRYTSSGTFQNSLSIDAQSRMLVSGVNGSIEVAGDPSATTVEIWGEKSVTSDSQADADAHLAALTVLVDGVGDRISVMTAQPDDPEGREYQVEYHILMPETLMLSVTQVNGEIVITGVEESVTATQANGSISLDDLTGSVVAEVANGAILADVALPPLPTSVCRLGTVNGSINLRIPITTSAALSAIVATGTITVTGLELSDIEVTPTSTTGTLGAGDGAITLSTVNGDIVVAGY